MFIMDIFRKPAVQAPADPMNPANPNLQQQQSQQPPQNQQTQQTQQPPANPQVVDPNQPPAQPPEVDYSKLWINDPKAPVPADPAAFSFNIDQGKVDGMFNTLDFTKAVTPELLAKISGGGQDAISATLAAMNTIAQQAVKTAVIASSKVTENGLNTTGQRMKDYIPGLVREQSVSNALREDNPLMSKPEYAPMVEAVTLQMARQFPQATPDEVRKHTSKYFDTMVSTVVQHSGKTVVEMPKEPNRNGLQTDWSKEPT